MARSIYITSAEGHSGKSTVALGVLVVLFVCRRHGFRFTSFLDAAAPGLILAQAAGRWGNWFNQELFGAPTDLPWGLEIDRSSPTWPDPALPADTLFHPTFLYEIIWNLLGVVVLLWLERSWSIGRKTILGLSVPVPVGGPIKLYWGKMLGLYLIWYGAGRFVWETIRIDPSDSFLGIRTNAWVAIFAVVLGILIIAIQSRRHYGAPPSVYLPGREWVPVVDSAETYSDDDEPGTVAVAQSDKPA